MGVVPALEVLAGVREAESVVVTNQSSARLWPELSDDVLDFNYNPSTMGGAIPFGLGVALAQREREVVVVSGDGSLLMNLGSLVTVVESGARNLSVVLLDNGLYEVTGGQRTPGAGSGTDFAGLATAAGFTSVGSYGDLEAWRAAAQGWLRDPGPRFVWLKVAAQPGDYMTNTARPIGEQLERMRTAMRPSDGGSSAA
ncbi:MAG: hypothetical protein CMJ49_03845 [Planctomycetaceae bacterium]|nr:hypothetical protein [Planctomycetaceae bacterium]